MNSASKLLQPPESAVLSPNHRPFSPLVYWLPMQAWFFETPFKPTKQFTYIYIYRKKNLHLWRSIVFDPLQNRLYILYISHGKEYVQLTIQLYPHIYIHIGTTEPSETYKKHKLIILASTMMRFYDASHVTVESAEEVSTWEQSSLQSPPTEWWNYQTHRNNDRMYRPAPSNGWCLNFSGIA